MMTMSFQKLQNRPLLESPTWEKKHVCSSCSIFRRNCIFLGCIAKILETHPSKKSPTGPTARTPKETWVSNNSSIATYWTGSVGKVPLNSWWIPGCSVPSDCGGQVASSIKVTSVVTLSTPRSNVASKGPQPAKTWPSAIGKHGRAGKIIQIWCLQDDTTCLRKWRCQIHTQNCYNDTNRRSKVHSYKIINLVESSFLSFRCDNNTWRWSSSSETFMPGIWNVDFLTVPFIDTIRQPVDIYIYIRQIHNMYIYIYIV